MKKIFLTLMIAALAMGSMAANYEHSIGAVAGGLNGISYKGFISGNWALQADLGIGLKATAGSVTGTLNGWGSSTTGDHQVDLWDFVFNPNLEYQGNITRGFDWFAGAGLSGGFSYMGFSDNGYNGDPMGKFGLNAIVGAEYKLSAPLVIGLDFRPGYGLYARAGEHGSVTYNCFDWTLALAVRYCF